MTGVQGVNLLSPTRRMARLRRQRLSRWSFGLTVYAMVLALVWIAAHLGGSGADRTLAAELANVREQIEQSKQTIRELRPELLETRNVLAASRAVGNQPDWSLLLSLLAGLLDEQTVLTHCHIEPQRAQPWQSSRARQADAEQTARGPYVLELAGYGRSQAAVQAYVLRLEQTGLFEDVQLLDTRLGSFRDDEAVHFRVVSRLGVPLEPWDSDGDDDASAGAPQIDAPDAAAAPLTLPEGEIEP